MHDAEASSGPAASACSRASSSCARRARGGSASARTSCTRARRRDELRARRARGRGAGTAQARSMQRKGGDETRPRGGERPRSVRRGSGPRCRARPSPRPKLWSIVDQCVVRMHSHLSRSALMSRACRSSSGTSPRSTRSRRCVPSLRLASAQASSAAADDVLYRSMPSWTRC
jgi:hypothetical protein